MHVRNSQQFFNLKQHSRILHKWKTGQNKYSKIATMHVSACIYCHNVYWHIVMNFLHMMMFICKTFINHGVIVIKKDFILLCYLHLVKTSLVRLNNLLIFLSYVFSCYFMFFIYKKERTFVDKLINTLFSNLSVFAVFFFILLC